ncbi:MULTISPECIES: HupE/UreJ family protein [Croceitalea]|uniref:HupE/UreJ family protein n=1 Tax=Croceitalea vernalis TaxID=3075599 RepID=A0ABU3BET4_9FLAO|nr:MULTISPECIES: HupE/UreJ family protein [unclassified Croceitalea]MDT0538888.1 HupE/UreJ family protein [Croceitalea sp. P059]MDT0620675.1 HupE/UreJ family protein [Croceitalea sp. P007]
MQDFWFYIQLGLQHVLDLDAYDHILFLAALAVPFTFKNWKQVVILATVFTIAHCASLAFSVYGIFSVDVGLIEFLIPVTIALTALYNFLRIFKEESITGIYFQALATAFFGLIHGFGFSNYFKMLMAEEEHKLGPLLGFATGIELSQVTIILLVLVLAYIVQQVFKVKQSIFIGVTSIIIFLITIPMLIATFPN